MSTFTPTTGAELRIPSVAETLARRERLGMAVSPQKPVHLPAGLRAPREKWVYAPSAPYDHYVPKAPPKLPVNGISNGPRRRLLNSAAHWTAIVEEVCAKHGLDVKAVIAHRRAKRLVKARHECFWRLAQDTPMSLPAIGRKMGGYDHTTVLYGVKKHQARIDAGEAK